MVTTRYHSLRAAGINAAHARRDHYLLQVGPTPPQWSGCGVAGFRVRRPPPRRAPWAGGFAPVWGPQKNPATPQPRKQVS
jgi:hypothetical protein